jgi:hypothetical protein
MVVKVRQFSAGIFQEKLSVDCQQGRKQVQSESAEKQSDTCPTVGEENSFLWNSASVVVVTATNSALRIMWIAPPGCGVSTSFAVHFKNAWSSRK